MTTQDFVLHPANERGHANHGWLDSYHTFSFADYYNRERVHFGVLRVLNDDIVKGGGGFGLHPHDNMEIITIPFYGELEHKDSMGHTEVIRADEIQVMSAGTGLMHSVYNKNADADVNLAQIWIFPNQRNVEPRYAQKAFAVEGRHNILQMILSPDGEQGSLWIHQDAWFYRTAMDAGTKLQHSVKREGNGVYVFVVEGSVTVNGQTLSKRDGIGIRNCTSIDLQAESDCECILMDIPMST